MEKYIKNFVIVIMTFLFVGCGKENIKLGPKSIYQTNISEKMVKMTIKEDTLSNTSALIKITNQTNDLYYYGNSFSIEYKKKDEWYYLMPIEEMIFTMQAILIKPNETKEINVEWESYYGKLPVGKYRIIKNVFQKNEIQNDIPIAVEFTIE